MWKGNDCELVDAAEPLRQGDLLKRFVNGHEASICVVITADCDIAQGKVEDSGVVCIDLRPLKEYLLEEHLTRVITRQVETRQRELKDWISRHWDAKPAPRSALTDQAIADWVSVASGDEIVAAVGTVDPEGIRYVENLVSGLNVARKSLQDKVDPKIRLRALAGLQKKPPQDWRQFVQSQLTKLQSNQLPDDIFFLTVVPNEEMFGYVAKLRSIIFVSADTIAASVPEARDRSSAYVRIARLAPTFKHGLAQQVGFLFARIGYPRDYESERDAIFDLVFEELCEEFGADHA